MSKKRPPYALCVPAPVTHEDFVVAWQSSATLAEAAAKMKTSARSASLRAHNMRKAGVALKRFQEAGRRYDVEGLTALAQKSLKEEG